MRPAFAATVAASTVTLAVALAFAAPCATAQCDPVRYRDLPHTDTVFRPAAPTSLESWQRRRAQLATQVRVAAGLWPEPARTPLNARARGRVEGDGYTVENVAFESRPGLWVTGNLYRPTADGGGARRPAVACPHGHWQHGRLHHDERGSIPARCITLARLGAVVFAYDMLGYNDSGRQIAHRDPRLSTPENALWGIGPLQLQTWNSIRVLDYLQSLDDVDPDRIGVTGASGGGTQTFILAAVDPRVRVAAPVNMVSGTMQGGCSCENAPGLRIDANNMEVAALFAPKPLLLVSATGDWTRDTPAVEFPFVQSVYRLFDAEDRVRNAHFDAPHNYNLHSRVAMYRFFGRFLFDRADADSIEEGDVDPPPRETLRVFEDSTVPESLLTNDALLVRLRADARARQAELRPATAERRRALAELFRTGVAHAIGSGFPARDEVDDDTGSQLWKRGGRSVARSILAATTTEADARPRERRVTLIVHPDGLDARRSCSALIERLRDAGREVVLIEPFSTGRNRVPTDAEPKRGTTRFFTTFNRTDAAETVFDVVTALAALSDDPAVAAVDVAGFGVAGAPTLLARALVPDATARTKSFRTVADLAGFDVDLEADYVARLNVPNLMRVGGLRAAAALAADRPLWLVHWGGRLEPDWLGEVARGDAAEIRVDLHPSRPDETSQWLLRD